ncbi:MAG: hypothetical protein ABI828_05010, partial [Actinomycetota bacterium]
LVTFGFAIPALAGIGVVAVWERIAEKTAWLAWAAAALAVGAMAAGAIMAYGRQPISISTEEIAQASAASQLADTTPAGTALIFVVDSPDATASLLATRAANVIRAALPPDRVADVYIYVGTPQGLLDRAPTLRGVPEYDALSRLYLSDIPRTGPSVGFVLTAFDEGSDANLPPAFSPVADGVSVAGRPAPAGALAAAPPPRDPLLPSSPGGIILATLAVLALLGGAGGGWAIWAVDDPVDRWLLAPAFGIAGVVLVGVLLERLGLPLAGWIGPTAVSVATGGSGYLLAALSRAQRGAGTEPADTVHQ